MNNQYHNTVVAVGQIGFVDAALIRYLENIKSKKEQLLVHVTGSIYSNLITKQHIEEFISAFSIVDGVIKNEPELERIVHQKKTDILHLPEKELQQYSTERIQKKADIENSGDNETKEKLLNRNKFINLFGSSPSQRNQKIGLVSGSFDLIHTGHVRYIKAAKDMADILIVSTMSTNSIRQQEKNKKGDRPIYNQEDRVKVLSSLEYVDHIVVFEELDCKEVIRTIRPDYFVKCERDMSRKIVKEECELVKALGGRVAVTKDKGDYSSTEIINFVREMDNRD